ncbi:hypothetical protein L7E55_05435 [Pelotomaculum isophthalicicum JI]|uniref:Uncharacterized protein n=1 Tax=Pelotomaculum isophthalicicum JI TaxID=947010 RepID=A0A9X4GYG3_9FIRM|nr:hypothetical protein [Pelotomaculum isophthalicicum]MDF9407805.1 hypothetical protein [Pelotomaculum isophthalicicum JI]
MGQMPLSAVIFYSIPEEIILFSFGVTIVGEYINFKIIFISSIITAFISMLLRACVPFGLHSIIGILVLFILFWKLLNIKPWKAIIASLFSVIVLLFLETIISPIILNAQNITLEELWKDTFKRIYLGYPTLFVYASITWFLYSKQKFLIKGTRVSNNVENEYNSANLFVTLIILFQGVFLAVINQHLDYLGKYSFAIKLLCVIFFISSVFFLNEYMVVMDKKKAQNRDKT